MVYLLLGAAGTLVSWWYMLAYNAQHGWWSNDFLTDAMINTAAASVNADLVSSTAIAAVFMLAEAKRLGIRHRWRFVALLLIVALAAALALFFYERERKLTPPSPAR